MPRSKSTKKKRALGRKPRRLAERAGPSSSRAQQQASEGDDIVASVEQGDDDMGFGGDDNDSDSYDGSSVSGEDDMSGSDQEDDAAGVDLGRYRYGPGDVADEPLVLEMANFLETQAAVEYEERVVDTPEPESAVFNTAIGQDDEEMPDVDAPEGSASPRASPFMPVEVMPQEILDPDDISQLLKHRQNRFIEMSKFEKAMAMYADLTGMSRVEWDALREILMLLKCEDGESVHDVAKLPKQLATLKNRIRSRLPLMDMRKAPIPLKVEKLPTEPAQSKGKGKQQPRGKKEFDTITADLHFFDPTSVFVNMLSSDVRKDMHFGPAQFVDEPSELYESHAWASSVRTSSGTYPHIPLSDGQKGAVIFPSDFIYFRCQNPNCHCQNLGDDSSEFHIGRVYGFGHDRRTNPVTIDQDELALQIQEAFFSDSPYTPFGLSDKLPIWDYDEVVLTEDLTYVPESGAIGHLKVYVDRVYGETHDDPQPSAAFKQKVVKISAAIQSARDRFEASGGQGDPPRLPKMPQTFPKYNTATVMAARAEDEQLVAKRMICGDTIVPLCHTHAIRAELEMQVYQRELFEVHWDNAQPNVLKTYSVPLLSFIDGVGIYRNSYRSLMGFYVTAASLSEIDRSRESNIFPIALGPHGSDFGNVIKALHTMRYLDEGIAANINGEDVRLCAFTLCYTGDMPQAAENCGFKGPRAHKYCRFCFAGAKPETDTSTAVMDIDIVTHGRYHIQTKQMQNMMEHQLTSDAARAEYGSQWGINEPNPPLVSISPALDLVLSRPPDAAHSEYKGISSLMHFLLRDGILKKDSRIAYAAVLRTWPFPPGSQRLQSPIHHLASYSLSDHSRWAIIIPGLLRHWLKEDHMLPKFVNTVHESGEDPVAIVVATVAAIAKSNSVLMARKLTAADRRDMDVIVRRGRTMFNQLNIFTSHSVLAASRAGSIVEGAASRAGSIVEGELVMEAITVGRPPKKDNQEELSKRANQYLKDTVRPNAHIAIHYPEINEEYALVKNVDTLEGESFHRIMKARVYETNYQNIEKILLEKINTTKSIRLVLRNMASDDPELTADLQELYQEAPSLFRKVLSETDRARIDSQIDDDEFELDVDQSTNATHLRPTVINRVGQREMQKMHHAANEDLSMPVRAGKISDTFRTLLRSAYEDDYAFPAGQPVVLGNAPIQWSRKFAFHDGTTETTPRFVFSIGDHLNFHRTRIGRVDAVFVFDCMGIHRHIFVVLTELHRTGTRDALLDLEVLEDTGTPVIVGLPAIEPSKLYIVNIGGVGPVLVDWDAYYL